MDTEELVKRGCGTGQLIYYRTSKNTTSPSQINKDMLVSDIKTADQISTHLITLLQYNASI